MMICGEGLLLSKPRTLSGWIHKIFLSRLRWQERWMEEEKVLSALSLSFFPLFRLQPNILI